MRALAAFLTASLVAWARPARADPGSNHPDAGLSLLAPPRPRGVTRVRGTVRPFFSLAGRGGGAVTDMAIEHQFRAPLRLGLELAPLALAVGPGDGDGGAIGHLRLTAAYATDFLEIGLGFGSRLQNFGPSGLSLAGSLRLGAVDGLRFTLGYGYALVRNWYSGRPMVAFANTQAGMDIPLVSRLSLALEAAFSFDAWAYGTIGLRHRLTGQGGAGTWIAHGAFGLAWVLDRFRCQYRDQQPCENAAWAFGPTLAFGLERRF